MILILIHSIGHYLIKTKGHVILSCGLFCYIGQRDNHTFSWDKFNALGLDNDERGGDSVGRAVGNSIVRFVNSKKAQTTYKDYVISYKNSEPYHIAIGHTRKASVGIVSEETAQPVVFDIDDDKKFIMVHNGTLYNWEELAKKYNIESKGKSDSMVLGEIIFKYGYDVLTEYTGAAALIIRDDREPDTIKVFKGCSKTYANKLEDERPLFYYQESPTSMYISSRTEGLYFIGGEGEEVDEFESNFLYTIKDGTIINLEKYDRTNCYQTRYQPTTPVIPTTGNIRSTYQTRMFNNNIDDAYDYGDYDSCDWNMRDNRAAGVISQQNTNNKSSTSYNIKDELIPRYFPKEKILCAKLRYYFKDKNDQFYLANGTIRIDEMGRRLNFIKEGDGGRDYYFYEGIMIKNKEFYKKVLVKFGKARKFRDTDANISAICQYSTYPVCSITDECTYQNIREWVLVDNEPKAIMYNGKIKPLFSNRTLVVAYGFLSKIIYDADFNYPNHAETKVIALPQTTHKSNEDDCTGHSKWFDEYIKQDGVTDAEIEEMQALFDEELSVKNEFKEVSIDDVFKSNNEPDNGDDYLDDEDELDDSNDEVVKIFKDGMSQVLLAIDSAIESLETTGINGKKMAKILTNLNLAQDLFLDVDNFQKKDLLIGYDEF